LNSVKSPDLTLELLMGLDMGNLYNTKQNIGPYGVRDGIGLGMGPKSMLKFKFGEWDINGIVCSGNDM